MKLSYKPLLASSLLLGAIAGTNPTLVNAEKMAPEAPQVQSINELEEELINELAEDLEVDETSLEEEELIEELSEEELELEKELEEVHTEEDLNDELPLEDEKEEIKEQATQKAPVIEEEKIIEEVEEVKEVKEETVKEEPMFATFSMAQTMQAPKQTTYTVKSGDTLNKIAKATNTTVAQLVAWNNIANQNLIRVGQTLSLQANGSSTQVVAPTPKENSGITTKMTQQEFLDVVSPVAKKVAEANKLYASVMIAQAALESGFGGSTLSSAPNHNMFGIKGSYQGESVGMTTSEFVNGKWIRIVQNFKKYPNHQASFEDNARLLRNGLTWNKNFYSGTWIENTTSFKDATQWLQGRYATDPAYASKLNNIINLYNLTQFDFNAVVNETIKPAPKPVVKPEQKPVVKPAPKPAPKPVVTKPMTTSSSKKVVYTIKRGDTLSHIALQYKTTVAKLKAENNLRSDLIFVGQKLNIPGGTTSTPAPAPKPATSKPAPKPSTTTTTKVSNTTYTIKRGDTLSKIARDYKTTVSALKSLNNLKSDLILVGQRLVVSKGTTVTSKPSTSAPKKTVTTSSSSTTQRVTVKRGDTLSHLAVRHKTTVAKIKQLNGLKSDLILIGQSLRVN